MLAILFVRFHLPDPDHHPERALEIRDLNKVRAQCNFLYKVTITARIFQPESFVDFAHGASPTGLSELHWGPVEEKNRRCSEGAVKVEQERLSKSQMWPQCPGKNTAGSCVTGGQLGCDTLQPARDWRRQQTFKRALSFISRSAKLSSPHSAISKVIWVKRVRESRHFWAFMDLFCRVRVPINEPSSAHRKGRLAAPPPPKKTKASRESKVAADLIKPPN